LRIGPTSIGASRVTTEAVHAGAEGVRRQAESVVEGYLLRSVRVDREMNGWLGAVGASGDAGSED